GGLSLPKPNGSAAYAGVSSGQRLTTLTSVAAVSATVLTSLRPQPVRLNKWHAGDVPNSIVGSRSGSNSCFHPELQE
ncbi:unnamed protein product, partial [Rotaria magnacalcarata]